jgi:hypothetical protein
MLLIKPRLALVLQLGRDRISKIYLSIGPQHWGVAALILWCNNDRFAGSKATFCRIPLPGSRLYELAQLGGRLNIPDSGGNRFPPGEIRC